MNATKLVIEIGWILIALALIGWACSDAWLMSTGRESISAFTAQWDRTHGYLLSLVLVLAAAACVLFIIHLRYC